MLLLLRVRRHPRVFGSAVCVVVAALCLVVVGVWLSKTATPSHHHHHHDVLASINMSKFIDGPRHLTLKPAKPLEVCGGVNGGVEVVVVVPSAPHNTPARNAVRESWAVYLPSTWALVFYVGAVDELSVQARLTTESHKHRDIAQDSTFPDTYSTLTLKTVALLSWTHQACPSATFILKADDDVFLNIPRLHTLTRCLHTAMRNLYARKGAADSGCGVKRHVGYFINARNNRYEPYVIGGYKYRDIKPDRSLASKWHLPKSSYGKDTLPNHLSGTAYLISTNLIPHLMNTARHTPVIRLEDVYITGLVASEGLKLRLSHIEGFDRFRPRFQRPCVYKALFTAHGFTPSELVRVTQGVMGEGVCDGLMTRIGMGVNSVVSALFPRLPSDGGGV